MGEVIVSETGVISVPDSSVTSAKIATGTIVDGNVNANAAIDVSKLYNVAVKSTVGNLLTANQATRLAHSSSHSINML